LRFSVVIPTFNRKDVLRKCLTALQSQDYPDYEVLVVDGGSDGTEQMMAQEFPRFRYLYEPRSGPSVARNLGIQVATGEIVAFTDDDCLVPPNWLSRLADGYQRYPEVYGVAGSCTPPESVWRANVLARQELWHTWYAYGLSPDKAEYVASGLSVPGSTSNVSYRRSILLDVGGFSTSFARHIAGEERELRERLCARGYDCYLYVPVNVLHMRTYVWNDFFTQAFEMALGVRRHLQRRARGQSTLQETDRMKRDRIPGLNKAMGHHDWKLVSALIGERAIYLIGRLLPEAVTLRLITFISKL